MKKIITIITILAIVFTLVTPHWWIKRGYWENKLFIQRFVSTFNNIEISYNENVDYVKKRRFIYKNIQILKNIQRIYINKKNNNLNLVLYDFTIYKKNFTKIEFLLMFKNDKRLKLFFPKFLDVKSIKVNGHQVVKQIKENSLEYYAKADQPIKVVAHVGFKPQDKKNIFENISYFGLFFSFFMYFVLFFQLFKFLCRRNGFNNIKDIIYKNRKIFCVSFFFFCLFMYSNNFAIYNTNYFFKPDIFFSADTNYIAQSILMNDIFRFHVYFFLPFYPIYEIMMLITHNFTFTLMFIFSGFYALSFIFLFKIFEVFNISEITNFLLIFIFGTSYTVITSYYTFESYVISNLYLSIFIYFLLKFMNIKNDIYNIKIIFALGFISALILGVNISNIVTVLILMASLFYVKRNLKYIVSYFIVFLTFSFIFCSLKSDIANENVFKSTISSVKLEAPVWLSKKKFSFVSESLRMPVLAQDKSFAKPLMNVIWVTFVILIITTLITLFLYPSKREDKYLFLGCITALIYNFLTVYFWCQKEGFLFAPNHFVLWFVIFAYCLKILNDSLLKNDKWIIKYFVPTLLLMFLTVEIPTNYTANKQVQNKAMQNYPLTQPIIEVNK